MIFIHLYVIYWLIYLHSILFIYLFIHLSILFVFILSFIHLLVSLFNIHLLIHLLIWFISFLVNWFVAPQFSNYKFTTIVYYKWTIGSNWLLANVSSKLLDALNYIFLRKGGGGGVAVGTQILSVSQRPLMVAFKPESAINDRLELDVGCCQIVHCNYILSGLKKACIIDRHSYVDTSFDGPIDMRDFKGHFFRLKSGLSSCCSYVWIILLQKM